MRGLLILIFCGFGMVPAHAHAEDGYELWLRYRPVGGASQEGYAARVTMIASGRESPTLRAARTELQRGLEAMLGRAVGISPEPRDGAILIGTPKSSDAIARLQLPVERLGRDGYLLRSVTHRGQRLTVVAANQDVGVLYGVFALLRRMQLREPIASLAVEEVPRLRLRMLNHWDNLDRHVERGYAGLSLWDWHKLPLWRDPRITDYARANASIGINATVLNNVNANAEILTPQWLDKVQAIADQLRPWGMRVLLSARFSAPMEIGGLKTADPAAPEVRAWWSAKVRDIYRRIPDFGGFLVKANSEGQPGPQDFGRSHADGANMLADALRPHGGTVLWRAFVYAPEGPDRARQAHDEFQPLDGRFRDNVVVQIKNGPIDFQPREPFHPLFGAMPRTRVALEVQLTKEYLGFATHLAYLGTMWEEVLKSRTYRPRADSEVGDTISVMAGVANAGTDRNWTGSQFDQANWYAFGRLAWDPRLSSQSIAEEWTRMTWGNDPAVVSSIVEMMMRSREAVVDYMTPLGLTHLMGTGHHYGPSPWVSDLQRPDWNPVYYHRADRGGIGFNRAPRGSNAVAQYAPQIARRWSKPETTPEQLLLWFHRVPWDHRLRSGRVLWEELIRRYDRGRTEVAAMRSTWASLRGRVDDRRYDEVSDFLRIQEQEALWWRDASIAYWLRVADRPLPAGVAPPAHPLEHYQGLRFPHAPGQAR